MLAYVANIQRCNKMGYLGIHFLLITQREVGIRRGGAFPLSDRQALVSLR